MDYISTRSSATDTLSFSQILMQGLAHDGGLYLPSYYPTFSPDEIRKMRGLSWQDIALYVIAPYVAPCITQSELAELIADAYQQFHHQAVTPLTQIHHNLWGLELWHGPTLAFKDVAMQLLGRLFAYFLQKNKQQLTILGATSGDTGSAAIEAFAGLDNVRVVILYPQHGPSEVQRRQMTTVNAENVFPIAVDGSFDDCQTMVKTLLGDSAFRQQYPLGSVNSINWARVIAQIVYYFTAGVSVGAPERKLVFSVPTGNFGDIFAGYVAGRMGLPIEKLIIASNANNILTRAFQTGCYQIRKVEHTLSPSMDIQISSNFERLLFELYDRDPAAISGLMQDLQSKGEFVIAPSAQQAWQQQFNADAVNDAQTRQTIQTHYHATGQILDPHTAVGLQAALNWRSAYPEYNNLPIISLACAHAAKFPQTIERILDKDVKLPYWLSDLYQRSEKSYNLPACADALRNFVKEAL